MSNFCPVCKSAINDDAVKCIVCSFTDLHREFITKEDAQEWLDSVVLPYRNQWELDKQNYKDFKICDGVLLKYLGKDKEVLIPNGIIKINYSAFDDYGYPEKIYIPQSVREVDEDAIGGTMQLNNINVSEKNKNYYSHDGVLFKKDPNTLVKYPNNKAENIYTIPNGVTQIGTFAFSNCANLQVILIPNSVKKIDECAFSANMCLKAIMVDELNNNYTSVNGVIFDKNMTQLIAYPEQKENVNYRVPSSVQIIKESTFSSCDFLEVVILPEGIRQIESRAFSYNDNLKSIFFPNSIINIDDDAFEECENLTFYCQRNSYAHKYATENNIPVQFID